ncbi:uncharacterized protein At4g15545-like isoform X2 [Phoenix dactylifera]|uniref:Uncharacterized protein At4g15545-like isoform X2 n=1 Tax=Phoenix dactylifera TaxID=42345 RepID=A0A8B8ZEW9_PHODC|nr:uncharacterized protein At4g15545-like isoform X2 [Phoenix dactylifera]
MTQSGGGGGCGGGADYHLPDEILAVIPTDPYEQLDLARKITSMAIASRVSKLELENGRMRQKLAEKDRAIAELQDKLSHLDRMFQEADARLRVAFEENIKLSKERDSLAQTSKKLARDLAKLETFKRHLMQSLNDDNSSRSQETVDIRTYDQSVAKASSWKGLYFGLRSLFLPDCVSGPKSFLIVGCLHGCFPAYGVEDEGTISCSASNIVSGSAEVGNMIQDATNPAGQEFSITPPIAPRLTPTATPKVTSTSGSPRAYSIGGSPNLTSGATSPTNHRFDGHTGMSPWYPSSQQSSAASSPPRGRFMPGRTPRIDGKEFFRHVRSRLSYEQFGAFLANIKELNAHRQSREETLKKAEEIFGTDNKDLYLSFQGLLNRNLP